MAHFAAVRTAALAVCAYLAIAGAAMEKLVHADPPCTRGTVKVDHDQRRLVVTLDNRCDAHIACKVSWRLRCGRAAYQERDAAVSLEAHGEERIEANATSCDGEGDWEITPPRWRCDEPVEIRAQKEPFTGKRPRRR